MGGLAPTLLAVFLTSGGASPASPLGRGAASPLAAPGSFPVPLCDAVWSMLSTGSPALRVSSQADFSKQCEVSSLKVLNNWYFVGDISCQWCWPRCGWAGDWGAVISNCFPWLCSRCQVWLAILTYNSLHLPHRQTLPDIPVNHQWFYSGLSRYIQCSLLADR